MGYNSFRHRRRSIRVKGYDYSQAGAYFVTVVTRNRVCLFGEIVDGEMKLNEIGQTVHEEWLRTGQVRLNVQLDEFIVMPNHFHGILMITHVGGRGTLQRAPTRAPAENMREQFGKPIYGSLASIVRAFKAVTTKRVNEIRGTQGALVWQRNYWEHIIRSEKDLERIRNYVINNTANWESDEENPRNVKRPSGDAH